MGYRLNSRRLDELQGIRKRLSGVLVGIAIVLLLSAIAAVKLLFSSTPSVAPLVLVLPTPAQGEVAMPSRVELQCFRAQQRFIESKSKECEQSEQGRSHSDCAWKLADFLLVEQESFGRSLSEKDLSVALPAYVLGTHDSVRVAADGTLDSNFELASQRAMQLIRDLTPNLKSAVPVPLGELPEPCLLESEKFAPHSDALRRTPALLILSPINES